MTKENEKISITAEFVSIMRAQADSRNLYFVSQKGQRIFNLTKKIFSRRKLRDIFEWRLILSNIFDEKILNDKPEQVVELAAGYSLRGFDKCLKDKNIIYIDVDLTYVISKKRSILESICKKENILFPENYFLVYADVLENNIFEKIKKVVSKNKKTLIISEGLTTYFRLNEFQLFLQNIKVLVYNFSNAEFYSHESLKQPKGLVYIVLRFLLVSVLTRSKRRESFESEKAFNKFLVNEGIQNYEIVNKDGFLMYSIGKN